MALAAFYLEEVREAYRKKKFEEEQKARFYRPLFFVYEKALFRFLCPHFSMIRII